MSRKIKISASVLCAAILGAGLHYALPQTDVVRIVDTETKRMDDVDEMGRKGNRDVYFIQAENVKSGKPSVYRNEDNLFYLKKNSADVQATSAKLAKGDDVYVAIKHYGWRNSWFSWFPNTLSVKQVAPDYNPLPIGNIIILTFLIGLGFAIWRKMRKIASRVSGVVSGSTSSRSSRASSGLSDEVDEFLETNYGPNSNGGRSSSDFSDGSFGD